LNGAVRAEAIARHITRLCHFTPFRNLVHIVTGDGLRSTNGLRSAERKAFNQQDLERLDGYPDHVSCSIEFPNAWYYRQKRSTDTLFSSWVVLTFSPEYLWNSETHFCHRNASARRGAFVRAGVEAFRGMFAPSVLGAGDRVYTRQPTRARSVPTDDQAEVLVPRFVALDDVYTVAVRNEAEAGKVWAGLEQIGGDPERFTFTIVPEFFQPSLLSGIIARGQQPDELEWTP